MRVQKRAKCNKEKGESIEIRNRQIEEGGINERKMRKKRHRCAFSAGHGTWRALEELVRP